MSNSITELLKDYDRYIAPNAYLNGEKLNITYNLQIDAIESIDDKKMQVRLRVSTNFYYFR